MPLITEYTPIVGKAITDAMKRTGYFEWACDAVGVLRRRGKYWRELGRKGVPPYDEFEAECLRVKAEVGEKVLAIALNDKGGAAFVLEHMFPVEFGTTGKTFHEVMQNLLEVVLPRCSENTQRELLDALQAVARERSGIGEPGVADSEATGVGAEAVIDVDGESVGNRELPASTEPER